MGRPKGGLNKKYTKELKIEVVRKRIDEHYSWPQLSSEYGIAISVIQGWVKIYEEFGSDGFDRSFRKGNPYAALHTSNSLSQVERLKLENLKLRVELERSKKGYTVKGVGASKEYVILNDVNTKSSMD